LYVELPGQRQLQHHPARVPVSLHSSVEMELAGPISQPAGCSPWYHYGHTRRHCVARRISFANWFGAISGCGSCTPRRWRSTGAAKMLHSCWLRTRVGEVLGWHHSRDRAPTYCKVVIGAITLIKVGGFCPSLCIGHGAQGTSVWPRLSFCYAPGCWYYTPC
jgi:hypothetical protein